MAAVPADEFRVELDLFEGPLDLLLFLIRKDELDLTELALAQVTAQYLAYLELVQILNISVAGDYMVHAATLVEIKSRLLLPMAPVDEDTEGETSAEELLRQLRARAELKELATGLGVLQERAVSRWTRETEPATVEFEVLIDASELELCYVLEQLLRSVRAAPVHEVRLEEWSVTEKMREIERGLEMRRRVDLTWLLGGSSAKGEKVAYFLAALELAKLVPPVRLKQGSNFGSIELVMEEV